MNNHSRRNFLGHMLKGAAVGLLGILPGTLFNRGVSFAAVQSKDTLESVLKRVTKSNLYRELNAAKLSPEEKVAIAGVKEIPRDELNKTIEKMRKGGDAKLCSEGWGCGEICGTDCGCVCGYGCLGATNDFGIVDRNGALDVKINTINKSRLLSALEKAVKLIKLSLF